MTSTAFNTTGSAGDDPENPLRTALERATDLHREAVKFATLISVAQQLVEFSEARTAPLARGKRLAMVALFLHGWRGLGIDSAVRYGSLAVCGLEPDLSEGARKTSTSQARALTQLIVSEWTPPTEAERSASIETILQTLLELVSRTSLARAAALRARTLSGARGGRRKRAAQPSSGA